ncbi:MAG: aminoacyl-tRNA hydrolase [Candidatus Eisenbacteria bacterium]
MPLVLGLGNPGTRYANTRHNVGWSVVERLVSRWQATPLEMFPEYRAWRAEPAGREVHLMVPLTFMNLSGEALEAWAARHAVETGGLLVLVDDVYLPLGRLRVRASGSSGGHRGLESLEMALDHGDWNRLRIGVGAAVSADDLRKHVLETFEPDEMDAVERAVGRAADAAECWCLEGLTKAMNRFNRSEEEVSES